MNYIYIGFSCPKKFAVGAWLLKIWQRSEFSHTYIRFDSEIYKSTVYHSANGMVHFKTFENFEKENKIIQEFKIECSKFECLKLCMDLSGQKYSYFTLLKIAAFDILQNLKITIDLKDSDGFVCSELVGRVLGKAVQLSFEKPNYLLTPKDIWLKLHLKKHLKN